MNTIGLIQARMGSTRLPNKVLRNILGKPMLWHIIKRVKASKYINKIVIATSTNKKDKQIIEFARKFGFEVYAGNEEDVLDRFYKAAKKYKADIIVRITADDPFKDPLIIDTIIITYLKYKNKIDYVSNTMKPTFPEGIDIEVISFDALKKAWEESLEKFDREHVTPYIWRNKEKFKCLNITYPFGDISNMRWTVDYKEDLEFTREIYRHLYKNNHFFSVEDILQLLRDYPEINEINSHIEQRESLKEKD